jgi:hypothetical protein
MMKLPADVLLISLLNRQIDSGEGLDLSEARIEEALTVGPGFSSRESQLLWRAPLARDSLRRVRDRLRRRTIDRWRASGIDPIAEFKAAADGAEEVMRIRGQGFSLTIFPDADQTMPWILSLQIEPDLIRDMSAGLRFQLMDSGGMVWLKGRPNSRGEINEGWFDTAISPRKRLLGHHLQLIPI